MPEVQILPVPAESHSQLKWATPKRIVYGIIILVFSLGLVLTVLHALDIVTQSTIDAVMMSLLAGIGIVAGVIGAQQRKKGNLQSALIGYRIAIWCLFFAFTTAIYFHRDWLDEDFHKRFKQEWEQVKRMNAEKRSQ